MDDKCWSVYVHINKINHKKYFGITSGSPLKRWRDGYRHNKHFSSSIDKYGWDNFEHIVLFTDLTENEAKQMEKDLIAKYHTMDREFGYNKTAGGDGSLGRKVSDETREKLRVVATGKKASPETRAKISERMKGENHPLYGKKRPQYVIDAMIEAKRNRKLTDEQVQHYRDASPTKRMVHQIDIDTGDILNTFVSISEASRQTGIPASNIINACKGIVGTAGGFIWQYDDEPHKYESKLGKFSMVAQIDKDTNEVIAIYDSIKEAAIATNTNASSISKVCVGKPKTDNGSIWKHVGR